MDDIDRLLINTLQDGLPVARRPFDAVAASVGIPVEELLSRVGRLIDSGMLSRFGPLFNAEKMGGAVTLCAMKVAAHEFDSVTEQVNGFPEVAHNYARDHVLNMWFVIATEHADELQRVVTRIEAATGCKVYNLPKLDEFYVGLKLAV